MIPHIKSFFLIITIFFTYFSCKKEIVAKANIEEKSTITIAQPIQKTESFSFYKAFSFCDNEISYFTNEEAHNLYADKKIEINIDEGKVKEANEVFTSEKLNCIIKTLKLQEKIEVKTFKTKSDFPFDNLVLVNNNYLITTRDGYFFVFSTKQETVNKVIKNNNIVCKEFEEEMTSVEECIIHNTTIAVVYDDLIEKKKLDDTDFLEKKIPEKDFIKEINNNGLISISYKTKKNSSVIMMRYDGGKTTIKLNKTGNDVVRKVIYSAD